MPLLKSVDPQSGAHFSDLFYPSCKKRAAQSTECNGKSGTNRKGFYPSFFHTWRDRPWGGRCWLENLPRETEQARMSDHPCSLMAAALRKMFWMEGRVLHFKAVPGNAGTAAERGINYTGPCLSGNTHATANHCQQKPSPDAWVQTAGGNSSNHRPAQGSSAQWESKKEKWGPLETWLR